LLPVVVVVEVQTPLTEVAVVVVLVVIEASQVLAHH
jgi:hypothetical protein